jgi:hypothetical protein
MHCDSAATQHTHHQKKPNTAIETALCDRSPKLLPSTPLVRSGMCFPLEEKSKWRDKRGGEREREREKEKQKRKGKKP